MIVIALYLLNSNKQCAVQAPILITVHASMLVGSLKAGRYTNIEFSDEYIS